MYKDRVVEKRVEVPVEKIVYKDRVVEKRVEVPVEKIVYKDKVVEKRVEVPVEKIVYKERVVEKRVEVPVEKIVYKERVVEKRVEVPVEKIVERIVEKRVEVPVEKIVEKIVEKRVEVPVEKIVEKIVEKRVEVPVEKIVEKIVEVLVDKPRDISIADKPQDQNVQNTDNETLKICQNQAMQITQLIIETERLKACTTSPKKNHDTTIADKPQIDTPKGPDTETEEIWEDIAKQESQLACENENLSANGITDEHESLVQENLYLKERLGDLEQTQQNNEKLYGKNTGELIEGVGLDNQKLNVVLMKQITKLAIEVERLNVVQDSGNCENLEA